MKYLKYINQSFISPQSSIPATIRMLVLGCVVAALATSNVRAAITLTGLYSSGVDTSGNLLVAGSPDTHWEVAGNAAYAYPTLDGLGPVSSPDAGWISVNGAVETKNTSFNNTTTFTASDAGTVTISGMMAADDYIQAILLNGTVVNPANMGAITYTGLTAFSITGSVVAGANTLNIEQYNLPTGSGKNSYGGILVQFDNPVAVPEPATYGILASASLLVVSLRSQFRRKQA
jgi:hypothetical protein